MINTSSETNISIDKTPHFDNEVKDVSNGKTEFPSTNCLNDFAVEGYVSSDVSLTYDKNKRAQKAAFYITNPKKVGKKVYYSDFYSVVYGKKAEECYDALRKGKKVTCKGELCSWRSKNEAGDKICGVTLNITAIYWD